MIIWCSAEESPLFARSSDARRQRGDEESHAAAILSDHPAGEDRTDLSFCTPHPLFEGSKGNEKSGYGMQKARKFCFQKFDPQKDDAPFRERKKKKRRTLFLSQYGIAFSTLSFYEKLE